jgi:hypothetical protein
MRYLWSIYWFVMHLIMLLWRMIYVPNYHVANTNWTNICRYIITNVKIYMWSIIFFTKIFDCVNIQDIKVLQQYDPLSLLVRQGCGMYIYIYIYTYIYIYYIFISFFQVFKSSIVLSKRASSVSSCFYTSSLRLFSYAYDININFKYTCDQSFSLLFLSFPIAFISKVQRGPLFLLTHQGRYGHGKIHISLSWEWTNPLTFSTSIIFLKEGRWT